MIRRTLGIYAAYFAQFLKSKLAYKANFFASIVANMLVTGSGILFILLLVDGESITALKGWNRHEVMFIYGYSMISMAIFSTFAPNLYQFGDKYIIQGQFDRVLLRPLDSLAQVLFESFNLESVGSLTVGCVLLAYASHQLAVDFTVADYIWLIVSSFAGGAILLSFFVFLASLSFHFEDRLGVAAPFFTMIMFGRYPTPIFSQALQFILRWLVPFAFVAFYPATHFLSHPGFAKYCYLTPVVALACAGLARASWEFGVSRYSSTGN